MKDEKIREQIESLICELSLKEDWKDFSPFVKGLYILGRKKMVEMHCKKGLKDSRISAITSIHRSSVIQITKEYWEDKMKNKQTNINN